MMFNPRDAMTGRTGDATAAAITQAAAHLLARHQDATVGAVAQATGVARGTIYRYFPTRHALLTAVLDQALLKAERHLTQANLAAVPASGRPAQRSAPVMPGRGAVCAGRRLSARKRAGRHRTRRHQRDRAAALPGRIAATAGPPSTLNGGSTLVPALSCVQRPNRVPVAAGTRVSRPQALDWVRLNGRR